MKESDPLEAAFSEGYGDLTEETLDGPGVWMHVPARRVMTLCLLREKPVRYSAHWVDRRLFPCPGRESCSLCARGYGAKVRYVYSVYCVSEHRVGLVEVGPATAASIADQCREQGFAMGLSFNFHKEGGVNNGEIRATCLHSIMSLRDLPEGPDPAFVLRKQWASPSADSIRPRPDDFALRVGTRSEERRES